MISDYTELFCQKTSSLTMQSSLFSHFKHHITYKGLVEISPSWAIIFICELYDGSTFDVEIANRCGILNKNLWSNVDDVVVDREITRKENLEPLGANPDIPSFLAGEHQPSRKVKLRRQYEFM